MQKMEVHSRIGYSRLSDEKTGARPLQATNQAGMEAVKRNESSIFNYDEKARTNIKDHDISRIYL